jgi:hypothetical protein
MQKDEAREKLMSAKTKLKLSYEASEAYFAEV